MFYRRKALILQTYKAAAAARSAPTEIHPEGTSRVTAVTDKKQTTLKTFRIWKQTFLTTCMFPPA